MKQSDYMWFHLNQQVLWVKNPVGMHDNLLPKYHYLFAPYHTMCGFFHQPHMKINTGVSNAAL